MFDFSVNVYEVEEYIPRKKSIKTGEYAYEATLPHQYSEWEITGNGKLKYENVPYSKEQAISDLELFIEEAKEALVLLKNLEIPI